MLNAIITWSLHNRLIVIAVSLGFVLLGVVSLPQLPIDAFPDTTPVQVQINTTVPGMAPLDVERLITVQIEQALGGLPHRPQVRSLSKFGLSQVVITFEDGTDIYFARNVVNEHLATANLPEGSSRPVMGPVATGLGEVFHYILSSQRLDPTQLRTLQDWQLKLALRTVPGTAEINGWGGYVKQYQVRVDPLRLLKHDLTFDQVMKAVQDNNRNVGGSTLQQSGQAFLIQGVGFLHNEEQVGNVVISTPRQGVPIRVRDVAEVVQGHGTPTGAVTYQGKGEAVLGLGFMLMGENSKEVTTELKKKLNSVKETLPRDVKVEVVYDRTELVDQVMDTVRKNLFEGGLLVVAVLFLFLGNLRAGLIVAVAIPFSLLFAFSGMLRYGISGSLLSLGALDFGLVVDSSVVMIENCVRHLAHNRDETRSRQQIVHDAALEVRKPTMFGELIIMIVYLPILTLEGVEGKLFRPMALTVIFALVGSMVLSLTLMPVLASLCLPRKLSEEDPLLVRLGRWLYAPLLRLSLSSGVVVLGLTLAAMGVAVVIARDLGSEFIPRLSEGAFVINLFRLPGTDIQEVVRYNTLIERLVLETFPDEVAHVWSRCGTAEIATDPMGPEETDFFITLTRRSSWKKASTQDELKDKLRKLISGAEIAPETRALYEPVPSIVAVLGVLGQSANPWQMSWTADRLVRANMARPRGLPGQNADFYQPIEQRVNEMSSGVKATVAIKIFGDDFAVLLAKAQEVQEVMGKVKGCKDLRTDVVKSGQPVLRIKVNQDQLARYGMTARAVLDVVESLGGKPLGDVLESAASRTPGQGALPSLGDVRFPLVLRLPDRVRSSPESIRAIPLLTPTGQIVSLSQLATVEIIEGPAKVSREAGQRRLTVQCNVEGRDIGSFIEEAQRKVKQEVPLPEGRYRIEWGGQFENMQRASTRLLIVVPVALLLIFGLLYITYNDLGDVLLVFSAVPFASVGGVVGLWLRGLPFSISAGVGFIALSGVSVLNSMVLVTFIRQLYSRGMTLDVAIEQAALTRLRPVLMTALVASLGFVPMALSTGVGAEVQRPLATVVIGGVISSALLDLAGAAGAVPLLWLAPPWRGGT